MVSGPQRLQPCAWTAPDLSTTAPALDSAARRRRLPKKLVQRPQVRDTLLVLPVEPHVVNVIVVDDAQIRARLVERDLFDKDVGIVAEALQPARDVAAAGVVGGQGGKDAALVVAQQLRHEPGPKLDA